VLVGRSRKLSLDRDGFVFDKPRLARASEPGCGEQARDPSLDTGVTGVVLAVGRNAIEAAIAGGCQISFNRPSVKAGTNVLCRAGAAPVIQRMRSRCQRKTRRPIAHGVGACGGGREND